MKEIALAAGFSDETEYAKHKEEMNKKTGIAILILFGFLYSVALISGIMYSNHVDSKQDKRTNSKIQDSGLVEQCIEGIKSEYWSGTIDRNEYDTKLKECKGES